MTDPQREEDEMTVKKYIDEQGYGTSQFEYSHSYQNCADVKEILKEIHNAMLSGIAHGRQQAGKEIMEKLKDRLFKLRPECDEIVEASTVGQIIKEVCK